MNRVLEYSKKELYADIANTLSLVKSSKEFWKCIKSFTPSTIQLSCNLNMEAVQSHFTSLFNQFPPSNLSMLELSVDTRSIEAFNIPELDLVLTKCKYPNPTQRIPGTIHEQGMIFDYWDEDLAEQLTTVIRDYPKTSGM